MLRLDQPPDLRLGDAALARDARHLERGAAGEMCGSSPDAEVVTRSIGTGASGFSLRAASTLAVTRVDQLPVGRPELAARRIGGIVAGAGRRRPRAEVARRRERLADDPRPDDRAVPLDQLTVGLIREQHLGDAGDRQRIDDAQQHAS